MWRFFEDGTPKQLKQNKLFIGRIILKDETQVEDIKQYTY